MLNRLKPLLEWALVICGVIAASVLLQKWGFSHLGVFLQLATANVVVIAVMLWLSGLVADWSKSQKVGFFAFCLLAVGGIFLLKSWHLPVAFFRSIVAYRLQPGADPWQYSWGADWKVIELMLGNFGKLVLSGQNPADFFSALWDLLIKTWIP